MANDVSPEMLSAFLNGAWLKAADSANTLRDQLLAEQALAFQLVATGSLGSVGKNSANQSYMGYGPGRITQVQIAETWSRLLSLHDAERSKIVCAFGRAGIAVPDGFDFDQPVYDGLTIFFNALAGAEVRGDITNLNISCGVPMAPALSW